MGKSKNFYIGKGFSEWGVKGMDDRGVVIETKTYSSIPKKTKIHGYNTYCAIEQNGKALGYKQKCITSSWMDDIENIAPNIKASLFGFGPYKNVTLIGVNAKGFTTTTTGSAKSANGVDCVFNDKISVYVHMVNVKKFRAWMKEWGYKFGLKIKGDVLLGKAEWQNFILKGVFPATLEATIKSAKIISVNPKHVMTRNNSQKIYESIVEQMKAYFLQNLGLTVTMYIGI